MPAMLHAIGQPSRHTRWVRHSDSRTLLGHCQELNLYAIPLKQAMAGLDINAPYSTSAGGEGDAAAVRGAEVMTMTAGHKLSLELVQHPHTPAAAKMEGVNAALGCGLDANARWCEGRASGIVGATLLASVLLTYIHTYTRTSI